jgi:hypothetical protein
VPVFAVSASYSPVSAGQDAAVAFGKHNAPAAAQPPKLVIHKSAAHHSRLRVNA